MIIKLHLLSSWDKRHKSEIKRTKMSQGLSISYKHVVVSGHAPASGPSARQSLHFRTCL